MVCRWDLGPGFSFRFGSDLGVQILVYNPPCLGEGTGSRLCTAPGRRPDKINDAGGVVSSLVCSFPRNSHRRGRRPRPSWRREKV